MNNTGYYIDDNGIKTIIPEEELYISIPSNSIIKLVCNHNAKKIYGYNSKLKELTLNDKLEILYCHDNQIEELKLNDNLTYLFCYNNQLKELTLNDKLEILYCDINTKLVNIPNNCEINIYE